SGFPVFVVNSFNQSGVNFENNGNSLSRPDIVGNPNKGGPVAANPGCVAPTKVHTPQNWFNPCAFAPAAAGELGDASRTPLSGPDFVNTDFSLIKQFRLPWENMGLSFRAEFFNLFNHPQFALPVQAIGYADINAANFGSISSTVNNPRLVQFALKFTFNRVFLAGGPDPKAGRPPDSSASRSASNTGRRRFLQALGGTLAAEFLASSRVTRAEPAPQAPTMKAHQIQSPGNVRWPQPIGSPVLDSLRPVIEHSRDVKTNLPKLIEVAQWMAYEELPVPQYSIPFAADSGNASQAIDFTLVAVTIDFAFTDFQNHTKFQVGYAGAH